MSNDTISASAEDLPKSGPDSELIKLGVKLEECHAARELLEAEDPHGEREDENDALYEEHWALRESIEKIAATTLAGVKVKANAVRMAHHFDPEADCMMDGSFRSLSLSIARDLLAL